MRRIEFIRLAVLLSSFLAAHESAAQDSNKAASQVRQIKQQLDEQAEKKRLEALKQAQPELYRRQMEAIAREKKIREIIAQSRKGELQEGEAKRKLFPLVKPLLASELQNLDSQIDLLERKLAFLKKVKKNPSLLSERRIEEMLGRRKPDPAEFVP